MKRLLFLLMITLAAGSVSAQPKNFRSQQSNAAQKKQQQQKTQGVTERMRIMYPTALDMPEDVVWRRDIYREINLDDEMNSGLYFPVEPVGKQMNLFTYILKLAINGYIPVYEYRLDGNEVLDESAKLDMATLLKNHNILFTEEKGKIHVDNSDIPSAEVKKYFLKESAYYDQANSSFHIKPLALCPVMVVQDDFAFSDDAAGTSYPLFWVKYSEVEPYLSRQTVMTSDKNNAATMTLDDYFTLNRYKGKIYKTTNMLGKTLAQIAGNDSTKLSAEQKRIEAELEAFRNNIFGDKAKRDSLDSIANNDPKQVKAAAKQKRQTRTKTVKAKSSSSSSSGGSSAPRVSVRRERH
ncbi:gliding motility protein GldN [Prevotella sp. E15-22]|uniref:type IX secretion system ring protein PorN/GldN n=1 Tax=Prevotella sp. E15-22 TaxID=2937774 RepID=UPI0020467249|nr:gliding motility protein GldN [Prevotella sp. E15-22]UPS44023.1 gliding motility protein GldN [Prevotella sp. E15-22]